MIAGSATHAFAPRLGTDVLAFYWSLIVMMGNESYPIKPEDQVFSTCVILVGMLAVRSTSHPDGFVARHGIME